VADMRRALGKMRGKETAEQAQKRADRAAAKAKAAKAKEQAALKPPAPEPAGTISSQWYQVDSGGRAAMRARPFRLAPPWSAACSHCLNAKLELFAEVGS
jgi:hypothetical protein